MLQRVGASKWIARIMVTWGLISGAMAFVKARPASTSSGRIAAVGGEVTGWRAGDAVTVLPLDWCGQCPACLRGHGHVCQRLAFHV
jgi:threonine dehydrogenase-like Zn-dependent dehydrogenase